MIKVTTETWTKDDGDKVIVRDIDADRMETGPDNSVLILRRLQDHEWVVVAMFYDWTYAIRMEEA